MGDTRFCCTRPVTLNDPDMNPVDYRILGDIQQRLYQTKGHDTDELKQRMLCLARGLEQSVINDAMSDANVSVVVPKEAI